MRAILAAVVRARPRYSLGTLAVFLLLVTSGTGLWWHREAWCPERTIECDQPVIHVRFTDAGSRVEVALIGGAIFTHKPLADYWPTRVFVYSTADGTLASERPPGPNWAEPTAQEKAANSRRLFSSGIRREVTALADTTQGILAVRIVVAEMGTGRLLATLGTRELYACTALSTDDRLVAVGDSSGKVQIFRRRRPERWWGVFRLTELWATVFFAALFAWSTLRDRRTFRRQESIDTAPRADMM